LAVAVYVGALSWSMEHRTYDVWGALISVPLLVLVSWPMLAAAIRREDDPFFTRIFMFGFALKLVGGLVRYLVAFGAYSGVADARGYSNSGAHIARLWWHGTFSFDTGKFPVIGTGFMRLLTGAVYAVSGPSIISGYIVFSWLGLWGLYLTYPAFRIGLPEGDHRRYAKLLFLLPSLLFWPSGIGKESWIMFCLGVTALGTARLFTRVRGGFLLLAAGLTGICMVRPHVALLVIAGVFTGYLARPGSRRSPLSPVWRTFGVISIAAVAIIVMRRATSFLGLNSLSSSAVTNTLATAGRNSTEGGSAFTPTPVHSIASLPKGLLTVLFRPFPWEAHNAATFVTALEGFLLLVLVLTSWGRLKGIARLLRRRPYVTFCIPYILLFVYAFSTFGNFGILARERVQVLPFVLVLASLPRAARGVTPALRQEPPLNATRSPA